MKIQIVSDLHLEFDDINITNNGDVDVLVLAGDIMVAQDLHDHPAPDTPYTPEILKILGSRQRCAQRYRDFLLRVSNQFPNVIYVAGNHEFYHGNWLSSLVDLREECLRYPNVHFLENNTVTISGVIFVGCTLWTDMNGSDPITLYTVTNAMNDYRIIRHDGLGYTKLRPAHTVSRHRQSLDYIKSVVDQHVVNPVVVVGHHAPSRVSLHPRYQDDKLMNGAYQSDLSEFILDRPQIKLWCHGHTHNPFDYMIGSTRIVCNPRGYSGYEETGWDPNYTVEV